MEYTALQEVLEEREVPMKPEPAPIQSQPTSSSSAPASASQGEKSKKRPRSSAAPASQKKAKTTGKKPGRGGERKGGGRKKGSTNKNAGYPRLHILKPRRRKDPRPEYTLMDLMQRLSNISEQREYKNRDEAEDFDALAQWAMGPKPIKGGEQTLWRLARANLLPGDEHPPTDESDEEVEESEEGDEEEDNELDLFEGQSAAEDVKEDEADPFAMDVGVKEEEDSPPPVEAGSPDQRTWQQMWASLEGPEREASPDMINVEEADSPPRLDDDALADLAEAVANDDEAGIRAVMHPPSRPVEPPRPMVEVGAQTERPVVPPATPEDSLLRFPLALMVILGAYPDDPAYRVMGLSGSGPAAWRARRMLIAGHLLFFSFFRAALEWLMEVYGFGRCAPFAYALAWNEGEFKEMLRRGTGAPTDNEAQLVAEVYAAPYPRVVRGSGPAREAPQPPGPPPCPRPWPPQAPPPPPWPPQVPPPPPPSRPATPSRLRSPPPPSRPATASRLRPPPPWGARAPL